MLQEPGSVKRGLNACALSAVPDQPVQSAKAYQGQNFPLLLYFLLKESLFLVKIKIRLKLLSLISLCRLHKVSSQINVFSLHRLIRDNPFRFHFLFKGSLFLAKIQFWRKVSSLISLPGLHRLVWKDTLRTRIIPPFHRAWTICSYI